MFKRQFLGALACVMLSACTGPQLLNVVARPPADVVRDTAYGPLPRQTYDTYRPRTMTADTPVLIFVHGGSWQYGSKEDYRFLGSAFAARGIETVVINYRLHPDVIFPDFVHDAAKAVAAVRRATPASRPIFVAGHSAGAQITGLLMLDPTYLAAEGTSPCQVVTGWVGLAGPYDFTPVEPVFKAIFPRDRLDASKPIRFATNPAPPALLLHGTKDDTVAPRRSQELATALRAAGSQAALRLYPGVDHLYIVGAISPVVRASAPTLSDMTAFINDHRKDASPACQSR